MNVVRRRYVRAVDRPFNLDGAMVSLWNCCGLRTTFTMSWSPFFALSRDCTLQD